MIRKVFGNLYFLTFLNGFLLASLFYFKMEANYENELFQAIHININGKIHRSDTEDSVVVKVMHECHDMMVSRSPVFQGKGLFEGFKSDILEPTSIDLMTARGACGSYSIVLARILQGFKIDVRIAQMKSRGVFAAHNIVEAKIRKTWIVLDPLYDLYFLTPSHELASFKEIRDNWAYYEHQLPADYNNDYQYEDVRYTNWTKIPVVLPAVKKILDLIIGKQRADTISIRTYFLRKYDLCFDLFLVLFIIVTSFTLLVLIKAKIFPQKNIPVTFSNVNKYLRQRLFQKGFTEHGRA